jgi:hypothetical protein
MNPFDLDQIVGGLVKHQAKTSSEHVHGDKHMPNKNSRTDEPEQSEDTDLHTKILQSYVEIPKFSWGVIPINTYVRYITNSSQLKTGSRVKSIEQQDNGSYTIILRKVGQGKKTMVWSINTKKIASIYKLKEEKFTKKIKIKNNVVNMDANIMDAPSNVLSQLGDKLLFDDISTVTTRLDMLESRTQRVEQDLKKLFLLIKRIYDNRR